MIRLDTLTCHDQMKGVEMSQYFDIGDETLWNPSNGVSRMFQRQVGVFEAELELPSGIGPMVNDECQISPDTFEIFVSALLAQHRKTHHTIRHALCEGFTATVLVLAERAGIKVDWTRHGAAPEAPLDEVQVSTVAGVSAPAEGTTWSAGLRARTQELGRRMPR
ncbi:DUF6086 family protein [Streptomyces sp. AA1529]|uniref:DUF6086 family protein n=1 Tax=Streptomyces sp. AA1529 TaxID=1203257 RepID=UPI003D71CDD6